MDKFTDSAREALRMASDVAYQLSSQYIGTEHLLIGLTVADGVASKVLVGNGVQGDKLVEVVSQLIGANGRVVLVDGDNYTPRARRILELSLREAARLRSQKIGTEHLLLAMIKEVDCIAVRLLNTMGVNVQKLYVDTMAAIGEDLSVARNEYLANKSRTKGKSSTPVLDQYSRDLTNYAKEGKLDPIIGREEEIQRVVQVLSRRMKNNPCLIGEPGVGKTAIAEGLAQKIIEGNVPETIADKRVMTLDLSGMVAGSKYRGEFEERIKRVIQEVKTDGNVLLFMDEIHTIIGAGGAEGAIDASNILKPSLARGEIQLIGATTREEYRKYVEKDAALERRFQPIIIEEPTEEESVAILKGLRERYESHHHVVITDEALEAAVKLSSRYVNDRYLPDKAIDVIDEASSKIRLNATLAPPEVRKLEEENKKLDEEKEVAIKNEAYDRASEIKQKQAENKEEIERLKAERGNRPHEEDEGNPMVGEEEVADIIAGWTKIPVMKLQKEETERLKNLENVLHERVVGQEEAVSAVAKAIRRGRVGLKDPNRPIGSFLFLGPTGVGKTELSKALAEAVFGKETAIIRVDMSEYMEKHSVSKLIGSPPGYVGYDEGGQLSEKVRRKPYSVILFDEIEKAHPEVFNILLQVLEDGHITDAGGRKVSFKNTIIIMTSNAGAGRIISPKNLGFATQQDESENYKRMKEGVMEEVKRLFKPEFLNRIDEMIVFHSLTKENILDIVKIMFSSVKRRAFGQMNISLDPQEAVFDHIAESGFDKDYGARPLRRAIQTEIEDKLAEKILEESVKENDVVDLSMQDGEIVFTTKGEV